jgi:hypothetical protein
MPFDWNKFRDGERFKFVNIGDKIEGEILSISTTTFGGTADPTPVLSIKKSDGTINDLTASQTVLCSRLAEVGPDVGDFISIEFTGLAEAKPGRSPAKLFEVTVTPKTLANGATLAAVPATVPESETPF